MTPATASARRSFWVGVIVILAVAATLRILWLNSDPPTVTSGWVGVVWHDEGAWVHNARNRAMWGVWRTDNWNPMFLTPVFTALEAGAFRTLGVGTWQARTVPIASGLAAIAFLMAGLNAAAGRRTALIGGALLAANYVFVMWNRAALMESTMTALIVISWAAVALAERRPAWGIVAGAAAALAWFTKASAAFFVAAIVIEAAMQAWTGVGSGVSRTRRGWIKPAPTYVLAGLILTAAIIAVLFVLPHWSEYAFYNWQMSVVRKPDYTLAALMVRASWLPVANDFFMWMWPVLAIAAFAIVGVVSRWRGAKPAERLLVLWVVVGLIELVIHDSGNERRYVMFIPAIVALAASVLGSGSLGISSGAANPDARRWLSAPLLLGLGFLVAGSGLRLFFLNDIHAPVHPYHRIVPLAAAVAVIGTSIAFWRWSRLVGALSRLRIPASAALVLVPVVLLSDATHFLHWAVSRRAANYEASLEVGRLLPAGTPVQGKLANGLSLENRIRPIFIGHGFGNYDDRLQRDDVRYILTYVSPTVGYESQARSDMIQELLDHYPRGRPVAIFMVNETGPADRAELFDKSPGPDPRARD